MKAVKCSVEDTVFFPLLGHVEWSEKLVAAERAAACFVPEDIDVSSKMSLCVGCLVIHW